MNRKMFDFVIVIVVLILSLAIENIAFAAVIPFSKNAAYEVCFTPEQDCASLIVDSINHAKESVFVQAYSFTSTFFSLSI